MTSSVLHDAKVTTGLPSQATAKPSRGGSVSEQDGAHRLVQRVATVAFEGIEARAVDVQVQVAPGLPGSSSSAVNVKHLGHLSARGPPD